MVRYVSTIVQCDECCEIIELDFASDYMVEKELEEKGWHIETGDDICPDCWKEKDEKEPEEVDG